MRFFPLVGSFGCFVFFYFLLILGLSGYMGISTEAEFQGNRREIPKFYREAGFKGKIVSIESEAHGFSTEYPYRYREKINGKNHDFSFQISGGWDEANKGKNYDTPEELARNYGSYLVFPFVEFSFTNTTEFKYFSHFVQTYFATFGIAVKEVIVDVPMGEDEDSEFVKELTKDLQQAQKSGNKELRGLTNLSLKKYSRLSSDFEYTIILSKKVRDELLNQSFDQLNPEDFLAGNYSLVYDKSEKIGDEMTSDRDYLLEFTIE